MKSTKLKKVFSVSLAVMMILGASSVVLAKAPEIPCVVQPRYSETKETSITAYFYTDSSVKCKLTIRAMSTSTKISGTLTLSGSDGSEFNWNVSGTGSASFNRTISGCNADDYTLTFSGYCGSEYINIDSVATR